ncbi:MAG: leucine-rich repeat protein [Clostridia bacterium]|nr:leucine-rich repeat protein [Clostridia bacterium]
MAVFKCKICGGSLDIKEGESVVTCEYCGTKQTVPRLDDERRINLYDRANHFLRNNDYDKATSIYEKILEEDKTDAEAYWSILLCKYGVEYVEDPKTHKRKPTVNRMQIASIFADEDYKSAIKYADGFQREIYESEAKKIEEIKKEILFISSKEEPFDVFICYKETDNGGRRTIDSVIAQELYTELKKDGYRSFFSRITLEDKLGSAYEPYIFSALSTAKVMVVIGTRKENFEAVWVKNEWARYLALIKSGEKKTLIPAFKDMDPYDLPEEFSHLQAQDMSKLGFMQDLVRGIKKILGEGSHKGEKTPDNEVIGSQTQTQIIETIIKRVYLELSEGRFESARYQVDRILDIDPENAEGYLLLILAHLKLKGLNDLITFEGDIKRTNAYSRIMKFGDDEIKKRVSDVLDEREIYRDRQISDKIERYLTKVTNLVDFAAIKPHLEKIKTEQVRGEIKEKIALKKKDLIYEKAVKLMKVRRFKKAIKLFTSLDGYRDSAIKIEACKEGVKANKVLGKKMLRWSLIAAAVIVFVSSVLITVNIILKNNEMADIALRGGQNLELSEDGTSYVLTSFDDDEATEVTILSSYKGLPVTAIGDDAFKNCYLLSEVTIADGITSIGENAFMNCHLLKSVVIPDSVTFIGANAFNGCSRLTSITLGSGVTSIENGTFSQCRTLKSIYLSDRITNVGTYAFSKCNLLEEIVMPDSVKEVGVGIFYGCVGLKSVTLSDDVTKIDDEAFSGCTSLSDLDLPASLKSIGSNAFLNCTSLSGLDLPETLESIGSGAFSGCSFSEIGLSASLTSIGIGAFSGCSSLSEIDLPEALERIGSSAFFGCQALKNVNIPDGISVIGDNTFSGCTNLESVAFSSNINEIGENAFKDCNALKTVDFSGTADDWAKIYFTNLSSNPIYYSHSLSVGGEPLTELLFENARKISDYAFYNLVNLTKVTFSDSVESIGNSAFRNSVISKIEISDGLTQIGRDAFTDAAINSYKGRFEALSFFNIYNLKHLEITGGEITERAFSHCYNLRTVVLGEGITVVPEEAFYYCDGIVSVTLPESLTVIENEAFWYCTSLTSITIPNNVENIGIFAFERCENLTSVVLGSGLKSIGSSAFGYCKRLANLNLGNGITSIGSSAFSYCDNLLSVTLGNGIKNIAQYTFTNCKSLSSLTIPDSVESIGFGAFSTSGLTDVNIGNGVTSIGEYAFYHCSGLNNLILGNNLKTIGSSAFTQCTSLTEVTFPSGLERIEDYAFSSCNRLINLVFGDCAASIGNSAFAACSSLTDVVFSSGITSVGENAFSDCNLLRSVVMTESVETIGKNAFYGCENLESLTLPFIGRNEDGSGDTYAQLFGYIFGNISSGGATQYIATAYLSYFYMPSKLTSVTILGGKIPLGAFSGYRCLTSITLPQDITSIGDYAFYGCSGLQSIEIPSGVKSIGSRAFYGCSGLTSFSIPSGVTTIDQFTFSNCSSLKSLYIPVSVKSIAMYAFSGNGLTDIYYAGSMQDWGNIVIDFSGNDVLNDVEIHYDS